MKRCEKNNYDDNHSISPAAEGAASPHIKHTELFAEAVRDIVEQCIPNSNEATGKSRECEAN